MKVIGWKIWYFDTSSGLTVYSSKTTTWEQLPRRGFLMGRLVYDKEYKPGCRYSRILGGNDVYFLLPEGTDDFPDGYGHVMSLDAYQVEETFSIPPEQVKLGIWVANEIWGEVKNACMSPETVQGW